MALVQQRRGTAADLASANEKPLAGQICFEIDTNRMKVGNGTDFYNDLDYITDGTTIADLDGLQEALDANAAAAAAAQTSADSAAASASQAQSTADAAEVTANAALPLSGGTMTGNLLVDGIRSATSSGLFLKANTNASVAQVRNSNYQYQFYITVAGSESVPSLAIGQTNTGLYRPSSNTLALSVAGDQKMYWSTSTTYFYDRVWLYDDLVVQGTATVGGNSVVTSDDVRLTDARTPTSHASSHHTGGSDAITPASIGAQPAGSYANLVNGTVPPSQLPSFVDDVIETSGTPTGTGEAGKIYVDTATNKTYRWGGSTYVEISASPGSTDAVPEGSVNLYFTDARAQNALSGDLAGKADTAGDTFTGDVTIGDSLSQSALRFATHSNQFDANATDLGYISLYENGANVAGLGITTSNFNVGTNGAINYSLYAHGTLVQRSNGTLSRYYVDQFHNGNLYTGAGSATQPVISKEGDSDTGLYYPGSDILAATCGGVQRAIIHNTGITLPNTYAAETGGVYGFYSQIDKSATNSGGTFAFLAGGNAPSQFNGSVYVTAGSASAPSIANRSATNTGVDFQGTSVSVVVSGNNRIQADTSGCYLFGTVSVMDGLALTQLQDGGASTNDVLTWNGTQWVPAAGGTGGSSTLAGLTDVTVTSPAVNQVLFYGPSGWVNSSLNTGVIAESGNLYYTDARAEAAARGIVGTAAGTLCAGNDPRLSDARTPTAHTHAQSDITGLVNDLSNKADLVNGTVPSSQLPSYVDDILEFANLSSFPTTGETGKIYVDLATSELYRWGGSTYTVISPSPGSTDDVAEGSVNIYYTDARAQTAARAIVGTTANTLCAGDDARLSDARTPTAHNHAIADVTNLQSTLDGKVDSAGDTITGDIVMTRAVPSSTTNGTSWGIQVTRPVGAGTLTNAFGISIPSNFDFAQNNYGVRIVNNLSAGKSCYAIYASGTAYTYLRGHAGFGTTPSGNYQLEVAGAAKFDVISDGTTSQLTSKVLAKLDSDTTQAGGGTAVSNVVVISQAAYTALATKDPNTLYFVT